MCFILSCNKDDDSITSGNYIEINGDRRIIDSKSEKVIFEYGTWGDPGYQFTMTDKQFSAGIADIQNTGLEVIITIWDNNLSKSSYSVTNFSQSEPMGYSQAHLIFTDNRGANINKFWSEGTSGNVRYSNNNGKRTIEFSNVKMKSRDNKYYTVSGRMEFSGSANNEHW